MSPLPCCGCHLESDYGTALVTGDGTTADPFTITQVDPTFERPVVRVSRTAGNQAIPTLTDTAVIFDTEEFDSDGMWDAGSPSRLTIPIAGIYLMGTSLRWTWHTDPKWIFFRQDGATVLHRKTAINGSGIGHQMTHNYMYYFDIGDYVEVVCFQQTGADLDIEGPPTGVLGAQAPICAWMMYLGKKV